MKKNLLTCLALLLVFAGTAFADDLGFGVGVRNHIITLDTSSLPSTDNLSHNITAYSARLNLFLGPDIGFYGRAELGVIGESSQVDDGTNTSVDLSDATLSLVSDFLLGFGFYIIDSNQVDLFFGAGIHIMSDLYHSSVMNQHISSFVFGIGADLMLELELSNRIGLFIQSGVGYGALALVFDYYDNYAPMDNMISWGLGLGLSVRI